MKIFISSFMSILMLSSNTYFISKEYYYISIFMSIPISAVWMFNVKNIYSSSLKDKMLYTIGALMGTAASLLILPRVLD
jgi:hypothetical protein